jgi:hypothetical protein
VSFEFYEIFPFILNLGQPDLYFYLMLLFMLIVLVNKNRVIFQYLFVVSRRSKLCSLVFLNNSRKPSVLENMNEFQENNVILVVR